MTTDLASLSLAATTSAVVSVCGAKTRASPVAAALGALSGLKSTEAMSRFMATHLQPYAMEPATACHEACNRR